MKKILFSAGLLFSLIHARAQSTADTGFHSRKLKLDEINLVSSYYAQAGDHAAVTGGIGTQKLDDIANVIDVTLIKYDRKDRKHSFIGEVGIDHYTSASSDLIDLKANSSASHADTRIYPSLSWSMENDKTGTTIGAGLSSSTEFDYQSFGGNISFAKKTSDRNGEFSAKLQAYLDRVKLVYPTELRTAASGGAYGGNGHDQYGSVSRDSYSASLSYSQVINQRLQVIFLADGVQQTGFLSLPFYRVYFADGTVHEEHLPDTRNKLPLGFRANYFLGDKFIIRTYYRYYTDDWGLHSNTANIELPVKLTPFLSVSPFYRFYEQHGARFFQPYESHTAADQYYSSNYDLSTFTGNFFGAGFRVAPLNGVFGNKHISMLELRYGHYTKNINMNADIVSLNLRFK